MSEVHCFTSVSFAYLDRARVLAETVKSFHPDWTLWLCLSDREPEGFSFDLERERFDRVVRIEELGFSDLDRWIFFHDVVELCTAVKGKMLCKIFELGAERVVYLDPDIALFSPLSEINEILDDHAIVLTPHLVRPEETLQGILDNEIGSLKHGTYNLGFIAVRGCSEGVRFAQWWASRLEQFCYDDIPAGLFTDQRWCDLIPAFFSGTYILRNPGYNVACWNLSNRLISFEVDGSINAGGVPLRFFHFTKVNSVGEGVLELYSGGRSEVFELLHWYRGRLGAHVAAELPQQWWAFGRYENGAAILYEHRKIYRTRRDLQAAFANPFASGETSFQNWCAHQLASG